MILSAGLSPARQQILTFDRLTPGDVNRARSSLWCASGKVLNVSRAVQSLGGDGHVLSTQGGFAGAAIREEFHQDGIPASWIETGNPTRVCTTVIDNAFEPPQITELVENASPITPDELSAFETEYARLVASAKLMVLTGSLPTVVGQGPPVDFYRRMLAGSPPAILDVRGPELRAALHERPLLVKPNRAELVATVSRPLNDEAAVIAAMHELVASGAQWVLVTDGPHDTLLADSNVVYRLTPPPRPVVNPIGCGDCLAAGIAVALQEGDDMCDAVRFGVAAAVENLGRVEPARLSLEAVRRTVQDVQIVCCSP